MHNQQVLFICNTPFQVVTAVCIRMHFYGETDVDLIITDQIQGYKEIALKAEKTGVFRHVDCAEVSDFNAYRGEENRRPETIPEKLRSGLSRKKRLKQLYCDNIINYSDIFLFNWDRFTVMLFEYLWRQNRRLSVHLYEEGITSYEHILLPYQCTREYAENMPIYKKAIRRLLRFPDLYRSIRDVYVFQPEMLDRSFPLPALRIPQLSSGQKGVNQALFAIFDCEKAEEYLNSDVIFFEESYVQDGVPVDYGSIMERLTEFISKDRILIKRHPRSRDEVFEQMGLRVNALQHVPWEIIVLRHPELCEKIWISICCSSMICPYYYLGMKTNSVFLFEMTGFRPDEKTAEYFDHVREKLLEPYPEVFMIPQTAAQLTAYYTQKLNQQNKEDQNNA